MSTKYTPPTTQDERNEWALYITDRRGPSHSLKEAHDFILRLIKDIEELTQDPTEIDKYTK